MQSQFFEAIEEYIRKGGKVTILKPRVYIIVNYVTSTRDNDIARDGNLSGWEDFRTLDTRGIYEQ